MELKIVDISIVSKCLHCSAVYSHQHQIGNGGRLVYYYEPLPKVLQHGQQQATKITTDWV